MTSQLEISDAKTRLDELLARANAGEEIVLVEQGKPIARLISAEDNPRRRALGMFKGKVWMSDDFQAPLTDNELKDLGL